MSSECISLITWMMKELSTTTHFYKEIVSGCYDAAIENYGFTKPVESKGFIIKKVIDTFNLTNHT